AAAQKPPNTNAAVGEIISPSRPATAKELAPATPTPAACIDTARDCSSPSSVSAIAFRPGMYAPAQPMPARARQIKAVQQSSAQKAKQKWDSAVSPAPTA